jgi:lipoprotein-anchoring transpeptidase ErfK/SrfK
MDKNITRRDFLKLIGLGAAGFAINPVGINSVFPKTEFGRVTNKSISIYEKPSDKSKIVFQRYMDDILNIYQEVQSEYGPAYNPIWYRVWGGYAHSSFVQKVVYRLNPLISSIPSKGIFMELTVPFSQSYLPHSDGKWTRFYRLYFSSVHSVTELHEGPDGQPWYGIFDGLVNLTYFVPSVQLREITEDEISPISPNVDPKLKKIEISIDTQTLTAFEGQNVIQQAKVSTGIHNLTLDPTKTSTDTPRGQFHIMNKRPSVHMGDGTIRSDKGAYELPGVPWVSYFESSTGVAIHGTYWHNNFGVTMSHGCVNMNSENAKWIYRWTNPIKNLQGEEDVSYRTPVLVY